MGVGCRRSTPVSLPGACDAAGNGVAGNGGLGADDTGLNQKAAQRGTARVDALALPKRLDVVGMGSLRRRCWSPPRQIRDGVVSFSAPVPLANAPALPISRAPRQSPSPAINNYVNGHFPIHRRGDSSQEDSPEWSLESHGTRTQGPAERGLGHCLPPVMPGSSNACSQSIEGL